MASVSIYDPNKTHHLGLGDFELLQLSRPTHKARFTRRGHEDVQLLVFLDDDKEVPFIRVPLHVLLRAAQHWEKSHYSKKEDRFIIANQDKMSFAEVAQVLGRSRDSVKVRAGKLGVSFRKIAETAPTVKLSNEDIELIRELAEAGLNFCEIARKFEVDNSHVRNVCQFHSRLYLDKTDYISHKKRQADAIDGMG